MSIKEKLYLRIIGWLNILQGYINTTLHSYYQLVELKHADDFLKKFRSHKEDPNNFSMQKRPKPNPKCNHRKGNMGRRGKYGYATQYPDYNVHMHNFSDGSTKIWCGYNCGFSARPGDPNWDEAVSMTKATTNTVSSSERVMWAIGRSGKDTVYVTKDPTLVTVQDKWGS